MMNDLKKLLSVFLILAMLLALAGCASSAPSGETEPEKPGSAAGEILSGDPSLSVTELSALVEAAAAPSPLSSGDRAFRSVGDLGKNLLLAAEGDNPVISPLSAYIALAMAAEGARGGTAEEFAALLGADAPGRAVAALIQELADGCDAENVYSTANSVWVDRRAEILKSYLEALAAGYGAEAFAAYLPSTDAMKAVNDWVDGKTNGLIPELLTEPLSAETAMILINTLYMKAKWASPFSADDTRDREFTAESGRTAMVPFMHSNGQTAYLEGDNFRGVVLPYRNGTAQFIALKPEGVGARELLESLDGEAIAALAGQAAFRAVNLSLPKFDVDFTMDMTETLPGLGLASAFDPSSADFSGMGTGAGGAPLYIGEVLQKTRIIVDEEGTEAAAATMIGMKEAAFYLEESIDLAFDQPFVYLIVDANFGAPLFMGLVTELS